MNDDPIIDRIREVRHRISEEHSHDPKKLVEYYATLDRTQYTEQLINDERKSRKTD